MILSQPNDANILSFASYNCRIPVGLLLLGEASLRILFIYSSWCSSQAQGSDVRFVPSQAQPHSQGGSGFRLKVGGDPFFTSECSSASSSSTSASSWPMGLFHVLLVYWCILVLPSAAGLWRILGGADPPN